MVFCHEQSLAIIARLFVYSFAFHLLHLQMEGIAKL